jgi:hypothetical protein
MHYSVLFKFGLATAFASLSTAHAVLTTLFIDDVNQGDGTCIRMAKDGSVSTHPIAGGLESPDMACGTSSCSSLQVLPETNIPLLQAGMANRLWLSPARPRLAPS